MSSGSSSGYQPPRRTPTDSSYYDFDGTPWNKKDSNSQTWMYASEARAQQSTAKTQVSKSQYPSYYGNYNTPPIALSTAAEQIPRPGGTSTPGWLHQPLVPGKTKSYKCGPKGGVRSVYPPSNPNDFDVVYHIPGTVDFTNAKYYPRNPR